MILLVAIQTLMLGIDIKAILNDLSLKKADLFYVFIVVPVSAYSINSNQILGIVILMLLSMLYAFLLTFNFKNMIVILTFAYILQFMSDHVVSILSQFFHSHLSFTNFYLIGFTLIGLLLTIGVYILANYFYRRQGVKSFNYSRSEAIFALFILLMYLYLIIFVEIKQGNPFREIVYNLMIIMLFTFMLIIFHYTRIREMKREYELREKEIRIKANNEYIDEMEKHYNQLRRFRHNYQNVLLSLDEYLRTDDMQGLKEYYENSVRPISNRLNQQKYKLEDLSKIENKEIKSILFNKLYSAQMSGIEVSFEAENKVEKFHTDTLDLALALGIILDNAIEETKKQNDGSIEVGIMKDETAIMIVVQNSIYRNKVPVWKMKEPGFSTKGSGRGIGLTNLSEIIDRSNNLTLETMKTEESFLQKITIEIGENVYD